LDTQPKFIITHQGHVGNPKILFKKKINWIDELEVWVLMQLGWVGKQLKKMKLVKAWFGQPTSPTTCVLILHIHLKKERRSKSIVNAIYRSKGNSVYGVRILQLLLAVAKFHV